MRTSEIVTAAVVSVHVTVHERRLAFRFGIPWWLEDIDVVVRNAEAVGA
jgi:hypothetical protein